MLNQMTLVGRIVSDLQLNKTEKERKFTLMTLAVPRNYKNEKGVYETDYIPCVLWNTIAVNTCEYCMKGDLVGIKGRIQSRNDKVEVVAEKITFISNRKALA